MTRLTESHLDETRSLLKHIDDRLRIQVDTDLRGVVRRTIGVDENQVAGALPRRVAVVPFTAGQGIIPGFSETVAAIAGHIGLDARVTRGADVAGISEAYATGSDIVVLADDFRFVAIDVHSGTVVDNDCATGQGFACLLGMMAGGVTGRPCGVIGCGPVGSAAALRLAEMGADLTVCDRDARRGRRLVAKISGNRDIDVDWVGDVEVLTARCRLIVDATPAARIIHAEAIRPDTMITAPGVPVGLTPAARKRIGQRFYHDNLPLGTATMVLAALFGKMTV